MCGSGKSEAVKFFENNGYKKVYFGNVVLNHLKSLGLEINEQNERLTRENLRKDFGMGAMAVKSLPEIKKLIPEYNVVIESLYSWDEYKILKQSFSNSIKLLTIFTTKDIRYKRLLNRKVRPLTFQESESRDISEIENLAKGGPIAFTDYLVINDGSLEQLYQELKKYI